MILGILKAVAVCYLAVLLLMYVFQRNLQYFPTPANDNVAEQAVSFEHQQQTLKGWVINPGKTDAIIYFGGNAEQIEQNITQFKSILAQYSVYLVNYRGFGQSTGKPTEQGLFDDARFIYDQIKDQHSNISVIGRSIGTGVACHLAANRAINKLVLVTPFDSGTKVAQRQYPYLPVSLLLKDQYESWKIADKITAKTLVFIAGIDRIVPPAHAKNLISHFDNAQITGLTIDKAEHNDISFYPEFETALAEFFVR